MNSPPYDGNGWEDDDREDEAWRLAETFDGRARDSRRPVDPELLDALAAAASDEVLLDLLDRLAEVCATGDRAESECYAAALHALAERLGADGALGLRAAVDVLLAGLYVDLDEDDRAAGLAARSERGLTTVLPELLGEREWVLARLADKAGAAATAAIHAQRAHDLWLEDERWVEAAAAGECALRAESPLSLDLLARYRRIAELFGAGEAPEEATATAATACAILLEELESELHRDPVAVAALCEAARDLARDHGAAEAAARVGLAQAVVGVGAGRSWTELDRAHADLRREFTELGLDPLRLALDHARVDLSWGQAALAHQQPTQARDLLGRARAAFGALDAADGVAHCETLLGMLDPGARRVDPATVADPGMRLGLLLVQGLSALQAGRQADARQAFDAAADCADELRAAGTGPMHVTALVDGCRAVARRAAGEDVDQEPVRRAIAAALADPTLAPQAREGFRALLTALGPERDVAPTPRPGATLNEQVEQLRRFAEQRPAMRPVAAMMLAVQRLTRSVEERDQRGFEEAEADLRTVLRELPDDPLLRRMADALTTVFDAAGGGSASGLANAVAAMREAADAFDDPATLASLELATAAAALNDGTLAPEELAALEAAMRHPDLPADARRLAVGLRTLAVVRDETDPAEVAAVLDELRDAVVETPPDQPDWVLATAAVALCLLRTYELTLDDEALLDARDLLRTAWDRTAGPAAHPYRQQVGELLAEVRELLGDGDDPQATALDGLRTFAWRALAQPDLAGVVGVVREAGEYAAEVARRCLRQEDPLGALRALDAGRGLALFAATEAPTFADRLDRVGRPGLAAEWRAAVASGDHTLAGPELRRTVLTALEADGAAQDLWTPPDLTEIRDALTTVDGDALVYLVPGAERHPGYAVVVPRSGPVAHLPLPALRGADDSVVARFLRAADGSSQEELAAALDDVTGWAWDVALQRLTAVVEAWPATGDTRVPRLVLVPMGVLATIPWQAARDPAGDLVLRRVAISHAVSARMLCRTAATPPVPTTPAGLVVGDPDTGSEADVLLDSRVEAYAVREVLYPGARFLGTRPSGTTGVSGRGTAAEVREWLRSTDPAAGTLLHLSCHGVLENRTERPTAYLRLAGDERLSADELVALMASAPARRVGTVVLAACRTDASIAGHDEAYSLGTAFLAGGAATVLSTLWRVPDHAAAGLVFMTHLFHRRDRLPLWAALHAAQLWMVDPARRYPDEMPRPLRWGLENATLEAATAWAGLVHGGR